MIEIMGAFAVVYLLVGATTVAFEGAFGEANLFGGVKYPFLTALFWPLFWARLIGKEAVKLVNSAIGTWAKLVSKNGTRIELRVEERNELADLRARYDGMVYRLAKLESWAQSQGSFRESAFVGGSEPEHRDTKVRTPMKA